MFGPVSCAHYLNLCIDLEVDILSVFQDSVSDVLELLKKQEDLEAMIEAQNERFIALKERKMQVSDRLLCRGWWPQQK